MSVIKRILMGVLTMGLFSMFSGCTKNQKMPEPVSSGTTESVINSTIEARQFPEGVTLTGFYMTHQGMAMEPYYFMKVTDDGAYLKITNVAPNDYRLAPPMMSMQQSDINYFEYADTVLEFEYASLVKVDEAVVRELENAVVETGALGWDGFNEYRDMSGVLDAGDSYDLYLTLSDGSSVNAHGYNVSPSGWQELKEKVVGIFEAHQDYSRYKDIDSSSAD